MIGDAKGVVCARNMHATYMLDEQMFSTPNRKIPFARLFLRNLNNFAHLQVNNVVCQQRSADLEARRISWETF